MSNTTIRSWEVALLDKVDLGESPVVYDIGANIGDYTQLVLDRYPDALVHCFEPNPNSIKIIEDRFKNESQVYIHQVALGYLPITDIELYYVTDEPELTASVFKGDFLGAPTIRNITVAHKRLDEYDIEKIDMMKIDTEGSELDILVGAGNYLYPKIIKRIQFEYNFWHTLANASFKHFWNLLTPHGYNLGLLQQDGTLQYLDVYDEKLENHGKSHRDFVALESKL